jgi:putative tricarboxylic transport membrane protein
MRRLLADPDARADLILVAAVWGLAAVAYYGAALLPPPLFDPLGSAAIPKFVAVTIALLGAAILVRRLMAAGGSAGEGEATAAPDAGLQNADGIAAASAPLRPSIALASIAIIVVYVGVMGTGLLGFREATVPFVIALGGAMSRFRRSTMIVLVPLAFVIAIGLAWLFSGALYIDLPVTKWLP